MAIAAPASLHLGTDAPVQCVGCMDVWCSQQPLTYSGRVCARVDPRVAEKGTRDEDRDEPLLPAGKALCAHARLWRRPNEIACPVAWASGIEAPVGCCREARRSEVWRGRRPQAGLRALWRTSRHPRQPPRPAPLEQEACGAMVRNDNRW